MNYLAVDTSGRHLTVIIKKGDKYFTHYDSQCGVNHSVALMPAVENLGKEADFDFRTCDFFVSVTGAGSFTGIRIGVSTIKAMCFAFNKPCLSITSFDTLAYNKKGGKILALIDAKHNGFYACGYTDGVVTLEPCYIMRDKVMELIKEYKPVSSTIIDGIDCEIVNVMDGLIRAIEDKTDYVTDDIESLSPLYVRKSQAEEGR